MIDANVKCRINHPTQHHISLDHLKPMAMAPSSLRISSHLRLPTPKSSAAAASPPPKLTVSSSTRRTFTFLLTASTNIGSLALPSVARDIPLFGLRRKLESAEKEAEEIVREGFEAAEKGIEAAEKGIEAADKGIEGVEKEIEGVEKEVVESAFGFGNVAQAGAVVAAEVLGVVVASSVVNGILGPDGSKA